MRSAMMDRPLEQLPVLFLDCQTTGANPAKGDIIEIGWACEDIHQQVETYLLNLPENKEIPRRVQSVTGISVEDIAVGKSVGTVWSRLLETAARVAQHALMDTCPTVIHFAKFEEPFLHHLHEQEMPDTRFPFCIICTHEIARRLFPGLPRRGIRAMAGYFGYPLGEHRRCQEHVQATAFIWQNMVRILKQQHNITTLKELSEWLDRTPVILQAERRYPMEGKNLPALPDGPGVYRMLRSNGDILYIGKAGSLKKRVSSYFRPRASHSEHILEMLSQARQINVTGTGSGLEAAILESDEIKQYAPMYNIALRTHERSVWFCNQDYSEFNATPDTRHRIGPFASQEAVKRLGALRTILVEGIDRLDDERLQAVIGLPAPYAPPCECIHKGFRLFATQHVEALQSGSINDMLAQLGRCFWLEHQEEEEEDDAEKEAAAASVEEWTPEACAHHIEANIRRAIYEIRRARWFTWLTDAALAWEEPASRRIVIVFNQGRVAFREEIEDDREVPIPSGYKKRFHERQRCFDIATFDRMRVVTTEIKKAIAAGRDVTVRFSPYAIMSRMQLVKMFQWI